METYPLPLFLRSRPVVVLQRATGIRDLILVNLLATWDWQCPFTKPIHSKHHNHIDLQPSSSSSLSLSSLGPSSSSYAYFHTFLHFLDTHIYPCSSAHSFYFDGVCGASLTSTLALYKMNNSLRYRR